VATGAFLPDHTPINTTRINNAIDYIRTGDSDAYKSLVNEQPNLVQQHSSSSKFVLHYAAEAGSLDLVRFTLGVHATQGLADSIRSVIDAKSPDGITPMMLAAGQGNYDVVEELLKAGTDVNFMNTEGQTALDLATDAGHVSISELLINYGADVKKSKVLREMYLSSIKQSSSAADTVLQPSKTPKSDTTGWNDLMISAYENRIADVRRCLDAGIDIEATAPDGRSALMISASRGNKDVVEVLLAVGANIDATNKKGWTALMIAVKDADHPTVSLLLSHGAELNHLSPDHWTALAEAAQQSLIDIMQSLLACGADTESRSSHDWTPLMHACYVGDRHGVDLLLAAGAGVENGSQRDETPILLAAAKGHTDIVRTLLGAGSLTESRWARKVEAGSDSQRAQGLVHRAYPLGWTPLMVACQGGHEDVVGLLLDQGANVEPKSPMERTALEIAQENGRTAIVKMLEEHTKNQVIEKAFISFYS
jgi:ankyrin repeat protein